MERRLYVHLDHGGFHGPVGRLWVRARRGQQGAVFRYEPEWLEHPGRFALDPELELQPEALYTRPQRALFGAFDDGAPDRWGRNLILRAEMRAARTASRSRRFLTEADYLLGVDDETRHGAVRYSQEPAGPFLAPAGDSRIPPLVELPRLLRAASRLGAGIENDDDLALLLAPGSSLGGARPKASVRDRDGSLSMAKFPREQDPWSVPAWEAVALSLARHAGIAAADARIERAPGKDVLVVRRFDRASDRRIPFVSAMTMLAAADHEQRSYEEVAEAIRREGAAPTTDLEELWRRIVFTVLISNHDDHLRNHGFLRLGDGGWRLSPAYDLNPTPVEFGGRTLTTAIVEGDPSASLELAFETAAYYGIRPPRARKIASEVATAVRRWREEAHRHGIPKREQELMASAFEHNELERARTASAVH